MNIFNLFHKPKVSENTQSPTNIPESDYEMVIIQFFYGIEDLRELHELEHQLKAVIHNAGVGEYHGHEISMDFGDGYLFIVGENAEQIYTCIKPLLESHYFMDRSVATLRSGSFEKQNALEKDYVLRYKLLSHLQ